MERKMAREMDEHKEARRLIRQDKRARWNSLGEKLGALADSGALADIWQHIRPLIKCAKGESARDKPRTKYGTTTRTGMEEVHVRGDFMKEHRNAK